MEQIKTKIRKIENDSYELTVKMIELEVIHDAVVRLLDRLDEIVHKEWYKDGAMSYLSINEVRNAVRLINMGFRPLFDEMNMKADELHSEYSKLFDLVREK